MNYLSKEERLRKILSEIISDGKKRVRCHNRVEIVRNISELVFSSANNGEPNSSGQLP